MSPLLTLTTRVITVPIRPLSRDSHFYPTGCLNKHISEIGLGPTESPFDLNDVLQRVTYKNSIKNRRVSGDRMVIVGQREDLHGWSVYRFTVQGRVRRTAPVVPRSNRRQTGDQVEPIWTYKDRRLKLDFPVLQTFSLSSSVIDSTHPVRSISALYWTMKRGTPKRTKHK